MDAYTTSFTFQDKLEILSDIWGASDSEDEGIILLRETYNIGLPLAYLALEDYVGLTEKAEDLIHGTFDGVLRQLSTVLGRGGLFDENFGNLREVLNLPDEREDNWDHDDFVDSDEKDEEGQAPRG